MTGNWGAWRERYDEWKLRNPWVPTKEKQRIVRGCMSKFAFEDFLTAMLTAKKMEADPAADLGDDKVVTLYRCELCGMEHIGRLWRAGVSG